MNHSRPIRITFGLIIIAVPLIAVLAAYLTPPVVPQARAAPPELPRGEFELGVSMQITPTNTATNTPTSTATNTATPTSTATNTPTPSLTPSKTPVSTPIYVDQYEPNNSLGEAYTTAAGLVLPNITLWPVGDVDYFRFNVKAGSAYEILTRDLDPGLDTFLTVYNANGGVIGTNDDASSLSRASKVTFSAGTSAFYFASIVNLSPSDPANKSYSFEVKEILGTATPTALPTGTPVPSIDDCEPNGTFQSSCVLLLDVTYNFDFVPYFGEGKDNDFFRIWVKEGLYYTCETFDLSSVNDTNMIFYTGPGFDFGVGGNDDKDRLAGDLGSEVSYRATYTGWLYVLVGPGPNMEPDYQYSNLYTYSMECTQVLATPTPTPTNTRPPAPGGGQVASPTPFAFPATPTPFAFPTEVAPTPRPQIQILPLPTATAASGGLRDLTLDVTIYYDANLNLMPELAEGIMDVAVAVFDNATGELLSIGFTNEAGNVRFGPISTATALRVTVPYLNYSQIVSESTAIQLRVAPRPLPGGIP
jgi:hypothetical protein